MRFKYSTSSPTQNEFDSLPRIPLLLRIGDLTVEALGLVDSGATINVLPYELGIQLGAVWDDRKAIIHLAGNLNSQPAIPLFADAQIGEFAPVRLAFAWVIKPNTPLILGQTNFFLEFDVFFTVPNSNSRLNRNRSKQPHNRIVESQDPSAWV